MYQLAAKVKNNIFFQNLNLYLVYERPLRNHSLGWKDI